MSQRSVLMLVSVVALTTSAIARADVKLGYVDLQRVLLEVEEGRAAKARLQKLLDDRKKDLEKEQEALRKEAEVLNKQAAMMNEETRVKKERELQERYLAFMKRAEKENADMATQERTVLNGMLQKVSPIIADIAQREGFTMVFDKTDSGLLYAPPALDITNEVVRKYNDISGGKKSVDTAKAGAPKKK